MQDILKINLDEFFKDSSEIDIKQFRLNIDLWLINKNRFRELEMAEENAKRIKIMHEEYERIYGHKYGEKRTLKSHDEYDNPREDILAAVEKRMKK